MLQQDLLNKQAQLQHQLQEKSREWEDACHRVDSISDEKRVLLNVIQQLCVEVEDILEVP